MLKSARLFAEIGAATAENEQNFAELLTKFRARMTAGAAPTAAGQPADLTDQTC